MVFIFAWTVKYMADMKRLHGEQKCREKLICLSLSRLMLYHIFTLLSLKPRFLYRLCQKAHVFVLPVHCMQVISINQFHMSCSRCTLCVRSLRSSLSDCGVSDRHLMPSLIRLPVSQCRIVTFTVISSLPNYFTIIENRLLQGALSNWSTYNPVYGVVWEQLRQV